MDGPVRFFLPEALSPPDAPGQAIFKIQRADQALSRALELTVRQTATRRLIRMPAHINDPAVFGGDRCRIPPLVWRAPHPSGEAIATWPASRRSDILGALSRHEEKRRTDHRCRRRHRSYRQRARKGGAGSDRDLQFRRYRMAGRGSLAGMMPFGDVTASCSTWRVWCCRSSTTRQC